MDQERDCNRVAGIVAFIWHGAILPWLVPLGTPVVIGVMARAQGLPWTEAFVFALVGFAAISHGLLRLDEWREKRRVQGELTFTQALVARSIRGDGMIIGLRVDSSASFPLEVEIVEMRTRLGSTVPLSGHTVKKFQIPARGHGWYYDHVISLPNPPKSGSLEGFLEFQLSYGRPGGGLPYRMPGKKQIVARFNADGVYESGIWHEAN